MEVGRLGGRFRRQPGRALLIFAMVLLYLLGWMLISMRTRLDTYVALLEGSIQEPEQSQPAPL